MKCDEALKYIYLSMELRLEGKEKTEFEEHLKSCTKCQTEIASAGRYFNMVSLLHNNEPAIENQELMAGNIIDAVHSLSMKSISKPATHKLDTIFLRSFRYAAAVILLLIGAFYFSEELASFQKIRRLENKYGLASEKRFEEIRYASINPVTDVYNLVNSDKCFVTLPGGWILIKDSGMIKKIRDYNNFSGDGISGVNYEMELKKFFSNPKIQKLMNQNEDVKNLFNRVFPEGVGNHE